ncbi:MurR/RpiR family transcriptional regulator [Liquorilactobacillus mali]|uniref:Transcriptional regulator n=1 Tax=Liquorilactobacillus mali KCTC 3596 = DSM 20444 TaxID=1046596 RepID=A0A0R2ECR1_9LACO|nr:MurR/RpiR family transcriptional regulator [Liquorilactobacillus mali]KRN09812.1 transcriptional regulator [Liquorilactobacillus mali KCTC 3596 = DSM 20444]MDC7954182.1 MurR/RpiR family transcriptional regulator [Liquorilactobacillus mali]QFQ75706.1 MurR/RpiR family transcriptional regulator [Liquorilactobacillus mali]
MSKKLSSSEQYLWNLIQNHIDKISELSIVKLSEYANVSTATIVRTMKKKGYSGYTAFRHELLSTQKNEPKYNILVQADSEIRSVIMKNETELNNTLKNLEIDIIEDTVHQIKNAKMVYVFARGLSESIGHELQMKLQLVDKYAELQTDPNIIKTVAKKISKNCVAIFISLNGETSELIEAAKTLEKKEVTKIVFTTNPSSSIAALSDLLFCGFKSETTYFPNYEVRSRLPLQIMTRILMDSYVVRTKK